MRVANVVCIQPSPISMRRMCRGLAPKESITPTSSLLDRVCIQKVPATPRQRFTRKNTPNARLSRYLLDAAEQRILFQQLPGLFQIKSYHISFVLFVMQCFCRLQPHRPAGRQPSSQGNHATHKQQCATKSDQKTPPSECQVINIIQLHIDDIKE